MFFSLSTIPAKHNKTDNSSAGPSAVDKFMSYSLLFIWVLLITFALISITRPQWLINISESEKYEEAMTFKRFGDRFLEQKEYGKAIYQYNIALKIQPDLYYALGNLAVVYSKLGHYKEAVSTLVKMIEIKPEFSYIAQTNLAEIYEKNNSPENAIKYYSEAAENAPFPFHLYAKLGYLYCTVDKWEKGIEAFRKSILERSDLKKFYSGMLERDYHRISDHPEVRDTISQLLDQEIPEDEFDRFDEVVFTKILSRDKEYAVAINNLGWAYEMTGELEKAAEFYDYALKIWPRYLQAKNNLDSILKKIAAETPDN
ncbi:MAG: hypothetical protein APR54_11865 [Candidatus Cloacimonas sp. SDB]|nr:MAG: hypothetical protein APR54_11865 [Candidatus Cloacimonas sp. SDB]